MPAVVVVVVQPDNPEVAAFVAGVADNPQPHHLRHRFHGVWC